MAINKFSNSNLTKQSYKDCDLASPIKIEVLVVGGGGGGASDRGGGGGAGGVNYSSLEIISGQKYNVVVGLGGKRGGAGDGTATQPNVHRGRNGENSVFGNIIAYGGGGGGGGSAHGGSNGGSGGGGAGPSLAGGLGVSGQGNNGGTGSSSTVAPAGGGGAGGVGQTPTGAASGNGGIGTALYSDWGLATSSGQNSGGVYYFAGGGGGGQQNDSGGGSPGTGGLGGGANGSASASSSPANSGTPNTGGGGGGAANLPRTWGGGNGGSGIVIVRYSDTYPDAITVSGIKYTSGGYKYYKFNESGSFALFANSNPVTYTNFNISANFKMIQNYHNLRSANPENYFIRYSVPSNHPEYLFAVSSTDWSQDNKTINAFSSGPTTPSSTYWRFGGSGSGNHDDIQLYFAGKSVCITNITYYSYPDGSYALDTVALQYWNGSSWVTATGLGYSSLSGWSTSGPGAIASYNPVTFTYSGSTASAESFKSKYWRIYFPPNCLVGGDGIHGHGANNLNFISFE